MDQLKNFFLRVLLWLPICFAAWYFTSILFTAPLAIIINSLMTWLLPSLIEQVQQHGNQLSIITRLVIHVPNGDAAANGEVIFALNPLTYGYCIPLYSALVLATPADDAKLFGYWLIGLLILFAVQMFGISVHILKTLAFLNQEARAQLGFAPWGYDMVALAYQFGYLIFPPVAPIVIWLGQFQQSIATLIDDKPLQ